MLAPEADYDLSKRICLGHRISVIGARALILQLRLDRITAFSHRPDVLGKGPADLATDEASTGAFLQELQRSRPV